MPKRVATRRRGKAVTTPGSASARTPVSGAATGAPSGAASARPRPPATEHDCPCAPQAAGVFSVHGTGEGPTPADATAAAHVQARYQLRHVVYEASKAHACKGSCVGVVILCWPEPSSFDVIIGAKHGPTGKITYTAFHGGKVTAWLTCELLSDEHLTELRKEHYVQDHEFVGWRLVPPGTTVA